jgi:DNA (cytosine-5)-methyltransferase 1
MRFGSVCSGIEAASVAWHPLGWEAAWLSEIEPFPSAVLAHHYPDVPNLGDMTALPDRIRSGEVEAPDLFCGGTPCQAFSVAGLRKSLDDDRGNLSLTFCEIADAIDDVRRPAGQQPAIIFWENVPGVLNTKDNAFGCFLAGLAGESLPLLPAGGRWTNAGCVLGPQRAIAWRVLDAQYFGVAQRRRRVFVVASARDDFDPAAVLFEFQGVRRDIAPSREAGKAVAPTVTSGAPFSRTGNERVETEAIVAHVSDITSSLCAADGPKGVSDQYAHEGKLIAMAHGQGGAEIAKNYSPTLTCVHEAPIVHYRKSRRAQSETDHETWVEDDVSNTLNCFDVGDIRSTDVVAQPVAIQGNLIGRDAGGPHGVGASDEGVMYTLTKADVHGVAQPFNIYGGNKRRDRPEGGFYIRMDEDTSKTLDAAGGLNPTCSQGGTAVMQSMAVRRLTPVECERLQGFPDGYTNVPWRKASESPDGPRYKALGNSWAVPVVRWIGSRIQESLK